MAEVIQLSIPPKQDVRRHRAIEYTLTYIPATKHWRWSFSITTRTEFAGTEGSYQQACLVARTHIDLATGQ